MITTHHRFIPLLALAAAPVHAAESSPAMAEGIGQMLFGLGIVLALLLGSLWLIKRLSTPRGAAAGLKVLGAVPVGPRERVVLVEIGGQVLVLGVTAASVRTLHTLPADAIQTESGAGGAHPLGDFQAWLKRSMERRNDAN
ncbi:MAG TPA: flagellar biosynthetic protein FliO [Aromatoleum sp.]|uniref:flagellar biosynthetic protein FliO n=1 Tax=Aromatoleum sp. TaxID=2307007 RepID=UPI002B49D517|nr:flagellar biosynthetic protein FliO [Aromatoleum sp.]HJV26666.1 flagellar biosynthetic protein FliO [Aromatoleum sp.]